MAAPAPAPRRPTDHPLERPSSQGGRPDSQPPPSPLFRHHAGGTCPRAFTPSTSIATTFRLCRRQQTTRATALLATLRGDGLTLHGFGWKLQGLAAAADFLASADSLAWSRAARGRPPLPGCEWDHAHCNNCLRYALGWRRRVLGCLGQNEPETRPVPEQRLLF
jgi:hypothetical protein